MPRSHFPYTKATQNKSDVTNGFGDRDFVLAVCTSFVSNSDQLEVIHHFYPVKNGGNLFSVDGSIAEKNVTSPFNSWLAV
jgi:hypothetical protein